jgi:hypothetical protein
VVEDDVAFRVNSHRDRRYRVEVTVRQTPSHAQVDGGFCPVVPQ